MILCSHLFYFFFFNDTATPEISPLSLHDALPISTRIRFVSWGLWTLIRLPAEKPGSSRNPCCAIGPPWQPDTAQVTVKMLSWIEASVGWSPAGGALSPLPPPQAARVSRAAASSGRAMTV